MSPNELCFVRAVCAELWNSELVDKTFKHDGTITTEELKAGMALLSRFEDNHGCGSQFVASHFYDFSVSDFDHLRPQALASILSNRALIVRHEDSIFEVVHRRASEDLSYFPLLEFVRFEFLTVDCMMQAFEFISSSFDSFTFGIWSSLRGRLTRFLTPAPESGRLHLPAIDSQIISTTPDIFSVLKAQQLQLLYRGSRDGFRSRDLHARCDGHPNTVSLIRSTNNCVFGGFTPQAWTARNRYSRDLDVNSFLFTIKNPHNLSARIFTPRQQSRAADHSLSEDSSDDDISGPVFPDGGDLVLDFGDLHVYDESQRPTKSWSGLGCAYVNNTGIAGGQVFTGSRYFAVHEIEVFAAIQQE
jgi:hypothetical protein